MKYELDKDLKSLAWQKAPSNIHLYPLVNIFMQMNTCRSDDMVMVTESLKCFPHTYIEVAEYDCLHDEGVAFAKILQTEEIPTELYEVTVACHGFETALKSTIVRDAMNRRIKWLQMVFQ